MSTLVHVAGDGADRRGYKKFIAQYPTLKVKYTTVFHDRFLIIDETEGYHIGASLKDAGKKCFGINKIEGLDVVKELKYCFRHETCYLPDYTWEEIYHYSNEEIQHFQNIIKSSSHLIVF